MPQNIPVLFVQEKTLAMAYEKALVTLYKNGIRMQTQYDKPGDPLSIDSTMDITVLEPLADPMIHKAFPGGIEDLREYVYELTGAKDHWVKNMNDPKDTRWEYTYHGRLASYGTWKELKEGRSVKTGTMDINQVEKVVESLAKSPFTRRAQMITWMPNLDFDCYDPPCLQSLWYRMLEDEKGGLWLNCNVRFRSNDAWGANFMNMFGFVQFNKEVIAEGIAKKLGRPVSLARMNWHADSWHVYGKDIKSLESMLIERLDKTAFERRVYNFYDPAIQEIYHGAEEDIQRKIREYDASHKV